MDFMRGVGVLLAVALAVSRPAVSCGPDDTAPAASDPGASPDQAGAAGELVESAEEIVGFLRGEVDFERIRVADTVELYLAPEGGGDRAAIPRELLRDRDNWSVRATESGAVYRLAPPPGLTDLTARVGRHFNCLEYDLASRYPALATMPHVGAKLEPAGSGGCLQSWNLTMIFDSRGADATLVAVVYDQWEW